MRFKFLKTGLWPIHPGRLWALLSGLICCMVVLAQVPRGGIGGKVKGFTLVHHEEEGRKTVVNGGEAKTLPNGLLEITAMVIETYDVKKEKDMIVEAPLCILDPKTWIATSSSELTLRTVDERFSIEGRGFRWQFAESRLQISNQVHTIVRRPGSGLQTPLLKPAANAPAASAAKAATQPISTNAAPPKAETIDIRSEQLDFRPELALFRDHVQVKPEEGGLTCERLTVTFEKSGGAVERIEAVQNVVFDQKEARTTGDKAIYLLKEDSIQLTGHPTWKIEGKEGTGEVININNKTKEFRVETNVVVKLLPDQMVSLDWLSKPSPTGQTNVPARQPLEVRADLLDYKAASAVFQGHVRVSDAQGGTLTCDVLTNLLAGPNGKLAALIADGNVEFKHGQTGAKGRRAVYNVTNEVVTLTGHPTWNIDEGEGASQLLSINPKTKEIWAEHNVEMKLFHSVVSSLELAVSKTAAKAGAPAATNQNIKILADKLRYKPGSAIFLNNVRVLSPEDTRQEMGCEVLAAFFAAADNKLEELVAEDQVNIRQGELSATGQKAVYRMAKGLVELTGSPQTGAPQIKRKGQTFTADSFILDRTNNSFRQRGHPRIEADRDTLKAAGRTAIE
jgi:lipopolysaccharide export system protein LptA